MASVDARYKLFTNTADMGWDRAVLRMTSLQNVRNPLYPKSPFGKPLRGMGQVATAGWTGPTYATNCVSKCNPEGWVYGSGGPNMPAPPPLDEQTLISCLNPDGTPGSNCFAPVSQATRCQYTDGRAQPQCPPVDMLLGAAFGDSPFGHSAPCPAKIPGMPPGYGLSEQQLTDAATRLNRTPDVVFPNLWNLPFSGCKTVAPATSAPPPLPETIPAAYTIDTSGAVVPSVTPEGVPLTHPPVPTPVTPVSKVTTVSTDGTTSTGIAGMSTNTLLLIGGAAVIAFFVLGRN